VACAHLLPIIHRSNLEDSRRNQIRPTLGNTTVDVSLHTFRSPRLESIAKEAVKFLEDTPSHLLPPPASFLGAGAYALYYTGRLRLYAKFKNEPTKLGKPIYVGKAVPPGWRSARTSEGNRTTALYGRLCEHARSIDQTSDLTANAFRCRFMILTDVEEDLIATVEAQLIRRHRPLWNTVVDGFGNHDPGKGRYNQAKSEWDVLHPGRAWVSRLTGDSPRIKDVKRKVHAIE